MMAEETVADRLSAAVMDATHAMNDLDREVAEITAPHDLAHLLADLADLKRAAGECYKKVEQLYISTSGERQAEVPGVGVVEIKRVTKYTAWRTDELWRTVIGYARDERQPDPETGEYEESEGEAIARVLRECSTPSWKVTGLRDHGLDPDEWCQVQEAGWSVKLPSREAKW